MIEPRRLRLVLGLQGLQETTDNGGNQHIGTSYAQAIARYHPDLIAAVSIDTAREEPHLLLDELHGVPIVDSGSSARHTSGESLVFHSVAPADTVTTARQLWPRWARDPSVGFVACTPRRTCIREETSNGSNERRQFSVVLNRLLRSADSVVSTSHVAALDVISSTDVDRHRVFVAREAIPTEYLRHRGGPASAHRLLSDQLPVRSPFVLALVANQSPGLARTIITAYGLLGEAVRSAHQLIVIMADRHDHDVEKLQSLIDERPGSSNILVLASPTEETRRLALQACEVAIVTSESRWDPVRPALEAMACGAVTVVADTDELRELVRETQSRFSPTSPESVASILKRSLTDKAFRDTQVARGARTLNDYSLKSVAGQLLIAYENAASRRR